MKAAIFSEDFSVNTMLVNSNKRLGLVGLLGMLQESAGLHSEQLGFGYDQMVAAQTFWVLIRQTLKMSYWPNWGEKVRIVTWPRPIKGMSAIRDFEIFCADKKCGECTTEWMVLDGNTRRPKRPDFDEKSLPVRSDSVLSFDPSKVQFQPNANMVKTVEVRNSDLDMNNHVNNTKYAQWILDAIPLELHGQFALREYHVNFLAETYLDDVISIQRMPVEESNDNRDVIYQGVRLSDQRAVFTARLSAKSRNSFS